MQSLRDYVTDCRLNGDLDDEIMDGIIDSVEIGSNGEFSVKEK